jgi:hypothetical protein
MKFDTLTLTVLRGAFAMAIVIFLFLLMRLLRRHTEK